jgi:hypothetical protein
MGGVVLLDRGKDAPTSVFDVDRFLEKVTACPLQILGDLDWIHGEVEWGAQVRDGCVQHVPLWRWKILFRWRWAFKGRARGARWVAATILLQGQHFDHGAKVAAFAVVGVSVTERVKHIDYLLREGLGNVEAVAADVKEGAAAEAIPEVVQVVADAVEGAKPPDEAGGDPLARDRWGSRPELDSARCRALPHGGRQLSWEFRDSSHGVAYRRGSMVVTMGPTQDCANGDTSVYLGSGPSWVEVKPLLPACFILSRQ